MDQLNSQDQETLRKLLVAVDKTFHDKRALFTRSFLSGLFSALGATIGVAIVIAMVGFLVRQLGGLPVVGDWLNELGRILPN
jgi:hypothetical protein